MYPFTSRALGTDIEFDLIFFFMINLLFSYPTFHLFPNPHLSIWLLFVHLWSTEYVHCYENFVSHLGVFIFITSFIVFFKRHFFFFWDTLVLCLLQFFVHVFIFIFIWRGQHVKARYGSRDNLPCWWREERNGLEEISW